MAAGETSMKLIKIVGSADGRVTEFDGAWLAEVHFDYEGDGIKLLVTRLADEAMKFLDAQVALELWRTQSKVRPLRPDGQPNRPLTAFTIEIVDPPAVDFDFSRLVVRDITRTSPISGQTRTISLKASEDQWAAYDKGDLIQRALPHLSDSEREFIMTGITNDEWDGAFGEDEDNTARH